MWSSAQTYLTKNSFYNGVVNSSVQPQQHLILRKQEMKAKDMFFAKLMFVSMEVETEIGKHTKRPKQSKYYVVFNIYKKLSNLYS